MYTVIFAVQVPAPPYPVMVATYLFSGFAEALLIALANAFVTSVLEKRSMKLGGLHACYGRFP